jgi:hypothetical protein
MRTIEEDATLEVNWIVMGGKIGEASHCRRCGDGLILPLPISIPDLMKSVEVFTEKHANCLPGNVLEPKIETPWDWLASRWTGVSSATIWSVMMGFPSPYKSYDIPYDSSDFHRCHKLLEIFPAWKPRLGEVESKFPFWAPFVREWANLSVVYEYEAQNEVAHGRGLYDCIKVHAQEAQALKRGNNHWTE